MRKVVGDFALGQVNTDTDQSKQAQTNASADWQTFALPLTSPTVRVSHNPACVLLNSTLIQHQISVGIDILN